jgi:hypothetical protein
MDTAGWIAYVGRAGTMMRPGGTAMADNKGNAGVAGAGAVYGLGLIGALVYYIGSATSFWDGVWGVLQSLVWPAFLVHGLLSFLKL